MNSIGKDQRPLKSEEITRYSRNILLKEVGMAGQKKLKESIVTIVGAGGLGSPSALYLAAAGVGEIRIIDSDTVDLTNLQRQILFRSDQIGKLKAEEARKNLTALNPEIKLISYPNRLSPENIQEFFMDTDLVLEGSDNFYTKFLVNDFCVLNSIPFLVAGILRFEGQVMGVKSPDTPCYRCTFLDLPPEDSVPSCAEAGVLGSIAGTVGAIQAGEALKYLLNGNSEVFGKILILEFMSLEFRKLTRKKNPNCPICGKNPKWKDLTHFESISEVRHC